MAISKTLFRGTTYLLAAVFLTACVGVGVSNRGTAVSVPTVELVRSVGTPLNATTLPLQASGYVEQEFYVRGQASRYRISDAMLDARIIDSGHPYVTRALVRRPVEPARFNGTVVVEWLNVSMGQDIDFVFGATRELLLREGYAWVGASVQRVGVDTLVKWNPKRYGNLSVAASNIDPNDGSEIDPALFPSAGDDVLGWDVFSQVGAAIADRSSPLMGGLQVKKLIASGESQSTFRLTTYYNSIQPLHHVYDGFFLYDRGGPLRKDVDVKSVGIGSEFMSLWLGGPPSADTDHQRWWEVAGASHVSLAELNDYIDPIVLRDGALRAPDGTVLDVSISVSSGNCTVTPIWSRVPNGDVSKAALKALNTWIISGAAPASVPRLVINSQNKILHDAEGRVQGGLRTAAYEAPRADNSALNTGNTTCKLAGYHRDFSPQEMCRRYGSQGAYVARVQVLTDASVKDGVLLPEEAKNTIDEAKAISFDCAGG